MTSAPHTSAQRVSPPTGNYERAMHCDVIMQNVCACLTWQMPVFRVFKHTFSWRCFYWRSYGGS